MMANIFAPMPFVLTHHRVNTSAPTTKVDISLPANLVIDGVKSEESKSRLGLKRIQPGKIWNI